MCRATMPFILASIAAPQALEEMDAAKNVQPEVWRVHRRSRSRAVGAAWRSFRLPLHLRCGRLPEPTAALRCLPLDTSGRDGVILQ
jgi:hypothetical protein